ncbi:DUF397 domain-containing protein [Actinomadura graeca]|uniref:DUF397 domain-containing protein n=1 Tax=Actinomadura graeca TaxID=2750812 RepID=A0ABX8R0F2_9ACTN|nr:DUF397 domain-containing protein [Actinomadura graeca]
MNWRKSSRSLEGGDCVEVAAPGGGGCVPAFGQPVEFR